MCRPVWSGKMAAGISMNTYSELDVEGYERVVRCDNDVVGFTAWAAIHDTTLGPALGGCRLWNYTNEEEAFTDVLRLSRGMTYKNALAGLALGGGKSVVRGDPQKIDRRALFENFGRFVDYLGGVYITAEDVNVTLADMEVVARQTAHVATVGASGNPSPFTAFGVYCALQAAAAHVFGSDDLSGLRVAIQGIGETGGRLAELLAGAGCKIAAADINEDNINRLRQKIEFERVEPEHIIDADCDIFSPCALGGILNVETIARLRCRIVGGSANNQLLHERDGEELLRRNILYIPDFAANAGGVINISCEIGHVYDPQKAREKTAAIGNCIKRIIDISTRDKLPTNRVAIALAEEVIVASKDGSSPKTSSAPR